MRGVTTDQRIADSRRERSQKKAERMRMITWKLIQSNIVRICAE